MSESTPSPEAAGQPLQPLRPGAPQPHNPPGGHTTPPSSLRAHTTPYLDANPRPAPQPNADSEPGEDQDVLPRPRRQTPPRSRRLAHPDEPPATALTPEQRLLLLDTWRRSGLPAGDFAALVGISKHTLYAWKRKFETEGPAGLDDKPRGGPQGSRLPEVTRRAILMLKQDNPDWGCEKISAMLLRGPALPASPQAVARVG
jgi:transposase